jgi:RHS repeat-associated protein
MTQTASPTTGPVTPLGNIYFSGHEIGSQSGAFVVFVWSGSSPSGAPVLSKSASWYNGSTASSMASAFAATFSPCSVSGTVIAASVSGSVVTLTPCQAGAVYSETVSLGGFGPGSQAAFMVSTAPSVPPGVYDSGTLSLAINGTQVASVAYTSNSSSTSIVSALVKSNIGGSPVTLTANGTNLMITANGANYDSASYGFAVSYNTSLFTQPSFSASSATGTLAGSQNAPLYNWTIGSYAPNGDVLAMTDSVMGTWSYSYDDLNRLVTGGSSAGTMSGLNLSWDYDRYGNRWDQNGSGSGSAVQPHFTFTGNNNRIDGDSYDPDGNLQNDGTNAYTYDAENRISTINGHQVYIYDATGGRVAKLSSSGVLSSVYILGAGGQQITEVNGSGQWEHSDIYTPGGRLLATYTLATSAYHYNLTDWLGTKRMQTVASGNQEEICTSYPFGDGLSCTGGADATEQHFTGKDRDSESGLDYFGARYLSSNFGRFMTPDWAASPSDVPYAKFGDPQSLNLYGYVLNNPNTGIDTDGHFDTFIHSEADIVDWAAEDAAAQAAAGQGAAQANSAPQAPASSSPSGQTPPLPSPPGMAQQQGNNTEIAQNQTPPPPGGTSPSASPNQTPATVTCTGTARVLQGNAALEGRAGGIPGQTVQAGSAAVIPSQFGVASGGALAPSAGAIHGTAGGVPFTGVTDVIGGRSPTPGVNVRTVLQQRFPGQLILEIPGGRDLGVVHVTIVVPASLGCPQGTSPQ